MINLLTWWLVASIVLYRVPPKNFYRGKIFTMPIRRRVRLLSEGRRCRLCQMLTFSAVQIFYPGSPSLPLLNALFWVPYVMLFMDDLLTGDDDKWKRFKDTVKNKVKWLMHLPPVPVEETA